MWQQQWNPKNNTARGLPKFLLAIAYLADLILVIQRENPINVGDKNTVSKDVPSLIDFPGNIADMFFHTISHAFGGWTSKWLTDNFLLITLWCPHFAVLYIERSLTPAIGLELCVSLHEVSYKSLPIHTLQLWDVSCILRMMARTIVMSDSLSHICLGNLSLLKANSHTVAQGNHDSLWCKSWEGDPASTAHFLN